MQNFQNSVQFIRAAHNLTIEVGPGSWRLLNGSGATGVSESAIALCAGDPEGLTCSPGFSRARQIPGDGRLVPADVARVVVGWAPESANWHLGLLLSAHLDSSTRLRWCGLASWPSGPAEDFSVPARKAGEALANLIARPLHVVPPPAAQPDPFVDTQALQPTSPVKTLDPAGGIRAPVRAEPAPYPPTPAAAPVRAPAVPAIPVLPPADPPYQLDEWVMASTKKGYAWRRRESWVLFTALRVVAFLAMGLVFIILGTAMQTTVLAKVNPAWLPGLGILVGVLLVVLSVRYMRVLLTAVTVRIDTTRREVICQGRTSRRVRWRVSFDAINYVLLTQSPARAQGRVDADGTAPIMQDIWLHVAEGERFWQVVALEAVEGKSHRWDVVRNRQKQPGRRALRLADYDTPAHHAARRMADVIGTELWLDIR